MTSLALLFLMIAAPEQRPVTPTEQKAVKLYFDALLLDGPSARWRFDETKAGFVVCGAVNAKNRMGAFTGWTPFYFDTTQKVGRIIDANSPRVIYETICLNGKQLD